MSTYYQIFGGKTNIVSSDPSNPIQGQVWYNSTSNELKFRGATTTGTFASSGNLSVGGIRYGGYAGTQTAGLIFTGGSPASPDNFSERYNGATWTSGGAMNFRRGYVSGCGTQTSALKFGGEGGATGCYGTTYASCKTEGYNGTSWTNFNDAPYDGGATQIGGTQTAALNAGDTRSPAPSTLNTFTFNGTSWTANPANMTRPTSQVSQCGVIGTTNTDLLFSAGNDGTSPPFTSTGCEKWNGTSWTSTGSQNTGRTATGGAGTSTASGAIFGGNAGSASGATELFNGSSWTSNPTSLNTARENSSGCRGTASASFVAGGDQKPGTSSATENYTGPGAGLTKVVTAS